MNEAILVIGDHHAVREALRDRLEMAFPQYRVVEAAGSQEAEAMVLSAPPYLIVVDVGSSAAEWFEVIQRIKAVQPLAKIVVWSIHDWKSYQADALAAGATAYVKKDTQDSLLTVLSAML